MANLVEWGYRIKTISFQKRILKEEKVVKPSDFLVWNRQESIINKDYANKESKTVCIKLL